MGAETFFSYATGPNPNEAFREAVHSAISEYGTSSYSGTVKEKDSFTIIQKEPLPSDLAYKLANNLIEGQDPRVNNKWGPAGAIPVQETQKLGERTITLTIDNPTHAGGLTSLTGDSPLAKLIEEQAKPRVGETITKPRITNRETKYTTAIERTSGDLVTRYFITHQETTYLPRWQDGHATVALARAAMEKLIKNPNNNELNTEVIGVSRRSDGKGLVTGTRALAKETLTIEVTLTKFKPSKTIIGWLFFGWASS